jgi:hypothetical protein
VAKVNTAGTGLVYCGYIGGSARDGATAITVDGAGNAYVTGATASSESTFPAKDGPALSYHGGPFYGDAFVARVNAAGTALDYAGYIGGSADELGYSIAVDSAGNAYVAGETMSTQSSFPVRVGPGSTFNGGVRDAFVAKIGPSPTAPVAVSPGYSNNISQPMSFTFTDPRGWQDLDVLNVLINNFLDGRSACYLAYSRSAGVLYLVSDAGTALSPGLVLNGTSSISNSQCTVTSAGSSVSLTGNSLMLTLNLSFSPSFAGNKVIYLAARDVQGGNSGWQALGTQGVPGATGPLSVAGLNPARGTGWSQTFTFAFSDAKGYQDLGVVNILINDSLDGRRACYLAYSRPLGVLYLVNDTGTGLSSALVLGGSGSVNNGQCSVNSAGSSASGSGPTLTLMVNIAFTATFNGNRVIYMAARDSTDANNSGWQSMGTWTVQ